MCRVIISEEASSTINYLHNKIGGVEWQAMPFFKIVEGDMDNPKDMVIKIYHLLPLQIGDNVFVSTSELSKYKAKLDMRCKKGESWLYQGLKTNGMVHTHHSMGATLSGTDMADIKENSGLFGFYLSLVVNWRCSPEAKLGIKIIKTCPKFKEVKRFTNKLGQRISKRYDVKAREVEYVDIIDTKVEYETPKVVMDSFAEVKKEHEKKPKFVGGSNQFRPVQSKMDFGEAATPVSKSSAYRDQDLIIDDDDLDSFEARSLYDKNENWHNRFY